MIITYLQQVRHVKLEQVYLEKIVMLGIHLLTMKYLDIVDQVVVQQMLMGILTVKFVVHFD
jgi:hypothetical protein